MPETVSSRGRHEAGAATTGELGMQGDPKVIEYLNKGLELYAQHHIGKLGED
jgi:hypothetical protein